MNTSGKDEDLGEDSRNGIRSHSVGYLAHAITCFGGLLAAAAILKAIDGQIRVASCLLLAASTLDLFDGYIARKAEVSSRLPVIDGQVLDTLVDHLVCNFAPLLVLLIEDQLIGNFRFVLVFPFVSGLLSSAMRDCSYSGRDFFLGIPVFYNVLLAFAILYRDWFIPPLLGLSIAMAAAVESIPVKFPKLPSPGLQPFKLQCVLSCWLVFTVVLLAVNPELSMILKPAHIMLSMAISVGYAYSFFTSAYRSSSL